MEITREFRRCDCGEKNDVSFIQCVRCGADISYVIIETEREESSADNSNEVKTPVSENIGYNGASEECGANIVKSKDRSKTIVLKQGKLVNKLNRYELIIPAEGGIIGREGTIGMEYFSMNPYVSCKHAKMYLSGTNYVIVDENSTNGTKINNITIAKGIEYPLKDGDLITLANMEFYFYN